MLGKLLLARIYRRPNELMIGWCVCMSIARDKELLGHVVLTRYHWTLRREKRQEGGGEEDETEKDFGVSNEMNVGQMDH